MTGTNGAAPLAVGLPVYNGLPYIEESMRSILESHFGDFELIVCDNASTDGTQELVQEMALADARIRYVRNERNIGAAGNYNRCFELSRSRFFRWGAADDLISAGVLGDCIAALENDPDAVLAFPQTRLIDATDSTVDDYDDGEGWDAARPSDRFSCALDHWGLSNTMFGVIRSDVLRRVTLQGDYPASDLVMQSDLAIHGRFVQVRGEYYYRRFHDGCTRSLDPVALAQFYHPSRGAEFRANTLRLFREHAGLVLRAPVSAGEKARMWRELARRARWSRWKLMSEVGMLARVWPAQRVFSNTGK